MANGSGLKYRPATTLVAALSLFYGLYLLLMVIAVGSDGLEIGLLNRALAGAEISDAEAASNDLRQGLIGLAMIGLYILLVVLFCVWVYRANKNARALGAEGMKFSPGWCVGWFFIPIMNLFKPYQAVHEIWKASDPDAEAGSWSQAGGSGLVGSWWALWLISAIIGQVAFRLSMGADTLEMLLASSSLTLVCDLLDIPLTICSILVIRGIHKRQETKHYMAQGEVFLPPGEEIV